MKNKSVPNLPASSRMQMPSGGGSKVASAVKEKGGMAKKTGTTKKIMASAKGKSVKPKY